MKEIELSIVLFGMLMLLMTIGYFLVRNLRKLREQDLEIKYYNESRSTFIDADNNAIFLKDENFRFVFVNKAFVKFFDKDSSEIIGHDDFDIVEEELAAKYREADIKVLEKKTTIVVEDRRDNKVFQVTKFPVKLNNGEYGVGAYTRDVTEEHNSKRELENANSALKENEAKLQLILNSTAEGLFGIDLYGNCSFCNISCLGLLGYKHQHELLGRNMHRMIHHSRKDGTPIPFDECQVHRTLTKGECVHVDDEVLWRADGTCFDAEYYSYPQYKDGEIIGTVVTFMDITDRKKAEKDIIYLSYHDALTGLYNRRFFEEEVRRLDVQRNLPISIIMGDVNNLKLINDIYGHSSGDILLKKVADVLRRACRADDIIAHLGGDEFIIILPKTNIEAAEKVSKRIKDLLAKEHFNVIRGSISLGCDTKNSENEDITQIKENAEDKMYLEKTLDRKNINKTTIKTIINKLHENYPREEEHSKRVEELSLNIGRAMNLSDAEIRRLKDAAFLHDIGKVVIEESIVNKKGELTDHEMQEVKQHPTVGYRILNTSDETLELAKYILSHHERWDGSGYPKGLKGEDIPRLARIISLADSYDAMTNSSNCRNAMSKEEAILEIKKNAGSQFDPSIAEIFMRVLKEEQ